MELPASALAFVTPTPPRMGEGTMDAAVLNPWSNRIALVTGGNRGVGLETCRQLATKGLRVVLTARNTARGLEAVKAIRSSSAAAEVFFHQLDVTDPSSAARLADFIRGQFGRLDILINNAGVSGVDRDPLLVAKVKDQVEGMDVNQRVEWKEFDDTDNLSEKRTEERMDLFLEDFKANLLEAHGWPTGGSSAYKVAKAALNAYTRILAKKYPALRINCLTPGYVKTDMSMHMGVLTLEEGARNPVKVALFPGDRPTGAYFDLNGEASFV